MPILIGSVDGGSVGASVAGASVAGASVAAASVAGTSVAGAAVSVCAGAQAVIIILKARRVANIRKVILLADCLSFFFILPPIDKLSFASNEMT
jgi:hypothetical protein